MIDGTTPTYPSSLAAWLDEDELASAAVALHAILLPHTEDGRVFIAPIEASPRVVFDVRRVDLVATIPTGGRLSASGVTHEVFRVFVRKDASLRRIEKATAAELTHAGASEQELLRARFMDQPPVQSRFAASRLAAFDARTRRVSGSVYFPRLWDPDGEPPADNVFNLSPVTRFVEVSEEDILPEPRPGPLRPSVDTGLVATLIVRELLENPTAEEEAAGFFPLDSSGLGVSRVQINEGIAQVVFFHNNGFKRFAGDLSRMLFKEAVFRTVIAFPKIKDVLISINI